jgi:hypothetical protein
MSYLDIENLYKDQSVLLFKEVYAMEKIHGTSAHVTYRGQPCPCLMFSPGGCGQGNFESLFDKGKLLEGFAGIGADEVTVFGEAYGGKLQGMRETYGPALRFICFEVKVGASWLDVPRAEGVALSLGLEFVHYALVPATIEEIDKQLYLPSVQAARNGCGDGRKREGVVLRPPVEVRRNNGARIIAKHKNPDFQETKTKRPVNAERLALLTQAQAIADEWVTVNRLKNIMGSLPQEKQDISGLGVVIKLMLHDIFEKEGLGEVADTREARKVVGARTAEMFKVFYCQIKKE